MDTAVALRACDVLPCLSNAAHCLSKAVCSLVVPYPSLLLVCLTVPIVCRRDLSLGNLAVAASAIFNAVSKLPYNSRGYESRQAGGFHMPGKKPRGWVGVLTVDDDRATHDGGSRRVHTEER